MTASPYAGVTESCDVVMKGGITSGIVYPLAVVELARRYRFASIGGASAGAMAAVVTAAAEYGRMAGGFERVERVPDEVGRDLLGLFQPAPAMRPLFRLLLVGLGRGGTAAKLIRALAALSASYPGWALGGLLPGLLLLGAALALGWSGWAAALGAAVGIFGLVAALLVRLQRAVLKELPAHDYGMCSGLTRPGARRPALTDWLASTIDEAAGVAGPLTFAELLAPGGGRPPIGLAMMTTNLSKRRPYTLPMSERIFFFERAEWEALFPPRIIAHLVARFPEEEADAHGRRFHHITDWAAVPIVVAARMSLSFPGLVRAVPLWSRDYTLRDPESHPLQRNLFSDGGISSNFPLHFFDRLWPNIPTFGIKLGEWDPARTRGQRVWMALSPGAGRLLPVKEIGSLPGFLMRLLDAAKDWQDNLRATLHGYRERIVNVDLKEAEGGLNLRMSASEVATIAAYGREAGETARDEFELDPHRWRRFLTGMQAMEELMEELLSAWEGSGRAEPFADFLQRYAEGATDYELSGADRATLLSRAEDLIELARYWRDNPLEGEKRLPKPFGRLRVTAPF